MEICRIVSSQCFSPSVSCSKELFKQSIKSVVMQRRRRISREFVTSSNGFSDRGHLKYYGSYPVAVLKGEKSKRMNKKKKVHMKLLKGLSRDLTTFSHIGFGLDSDADSVDQDKRNMISEAAKLLLQHLQKLRTEEKVLKKKRKDEKARLKAIKMQNRHMSSDSSSLSSSSSSSESSSDSECGEVIDMNSLKRGQKNLIAHPPAIEEEISQPTTPIASETVQAPVFARNEQCSQAGTSCTHLCNKSGNSYDTKIEVCMGGKCKKSGAGELLDKFRSMVGIEGSVSGCKCMGKCRNGPIVKVLNGNDGDKCVRAPSNPLCIGVGLEDVDMIVANFLDENQNAP